MPNFEPKDFSPINPPTSRPIKEGWYCSGHITSDYEAIACHEGQRVPNNNDFSYYDGALWRLTPACGPYPYQDFEWFGLKAPA